MTNQSKASRKREAVKDSLTRKLQAKTAKFIAKHGTLDDIKVGAIQQRKVERRRIYEEGK